MTGFRGARLPLRAGIAGAGLMARWHAHAVAHLGLPVTAIVDSDAAAAARLAARCPHAQVFPDLTSALERHVFDVLHVCTPLPTHRELAEHALRAGVHILIEKPMTPTAAESEELLGLAAQRNLLLCPVHQFLFQEGVLRTLARRAPVGPIMQLYATIHSAGEGSAPEQLDSVAANILPHPLALMQRFLDAPLPTRGWTTVHPARGEITASAHAGETTLTASISMHARPTTCSFDVIGTHGSVHMDLYHGYAVAEPGHVSRLRKLVHPFDLSVRTFTAASANLGRRIFFREPAFPGLRNLIAAFYASVHRGGASPIPAQEALSVAQARDHIIEQAGLPTQ